MLRPGIASGVRGFLQDCGTLKVTAFLQDAFLGLDPVGCFLNDGVKVGGVAGEAAAGVAEAVAGL